MVIVRATWTNREIWRYGIRFLRLHDPKSYVSLNHLHMYRYGGSIEQQIDATCEDTGWMKGRKESWMRYNRGNWGIMLLWSMVAGTFVWWAWRGYFWFNGGSSMFNVGQIHA